MPIVHQTLQSINRARMAPAQLSGDALTLNGSGFGTKSTAAPFLWMPLVSNADAQTAQAAGLDLYNTDETTSPATDCVVTSAQTLGPAKSLVWHGNGETDAQNTAVPIFAVDLPASTQSVLISAWFRVSRVGTTIGGQAQMKMSRTGVYGGGSVTNAGNHYAASPHQSCSLFASSEFDWVTGVNSAGFNSYLDLESSVPGTVSYNDPNPNITGVDTWWHWQMYSKFTDIGSSNGELEAIINSTTIASRTGLNNRSADQWHNWASIWTGFQMIGRDWDVYFTRCYIDVNTRACIWLGNASTLAACTGRWLLSPSAWSDTQITATGIENRPSGYDYAYVTTDAGSTNSSGYAL